MSYLSTREAAKRLGIGHNTLAQYIRLGKVVTPRAVTTGTTTVHLWSEEEIEQVRKLLPKIANGRKTRWQKVREKKQETQARAPALQKPKKKKLKK